MTHRLDFVTATLEVPAGVQAGSEMAARAEEHTSELQSHLNLVCSLLLEQKYSSL